MITHMAAVGLVAVLGAAAPPARAARIVVPFDFGWRHQLVAPPAVTGSGSAGVADDVHVQVGPGADPPEAAPGYQDGGWDRVRLPHDGLIALGASNGSCPASSSCIPRRAMWYPGLQNLRLVSRTPERGVCFLVEEVQHLHTPFQ